MAKRLTAYSDVIKNTCSLASQKLVKAQSFSNPVNDSIRSAAQ